MAFLFGYLRYKSHRSGLNFCKYVGPGRGDDQSRSQLGARPSLIPQAMEAFWRGRAGVGVRPGASDPASSHTCLLPGLFRKHTHVRRLTCLLDHVSPFFWKDILYI